MTNQDFESKIVSGPMTMDERVRLAREGWAFAKLVRIDGQEHYTWRRSRHMSFEPVGYVSHRGYLYCRSCALKFYGVDGVSGVPDNWHVVHRDSEPHAFEDCECCHKVVNTPSVR